MVKLCCIPICPNSKANRGVPCYPFPATDKVLRGKWIEFVVGATAGSSRFRWKTKHICADHFHQLDLVATSGGDQRLPVEGAIPSIYSPDEADGDTLLERDGEMASGSAVSGEPVGQCALFCRICLKKAPGLIPFNSKLHNENLVDVIYLVSGLELDAEEANLPKKICASCVEKVDLAFNVRKEFILCEEILRNMIKYGQLEAYYRCYDNHPEDSRSKDRAYLTNLVKDVKTELIIEPMEVMEEEHLDEAEEEIVAEELLEDYLVEPETSQNEIKVEVYSDSEDEKKKTKKEAKKIVYSWKELYKPKRPRQQREYKITEDLPEPKLVPNTCYVCDTVHENADALDSHVEQHVSLLPYTCTQCTTEEYPCVLKSLITLNKHLQSHTYPYVCDFCPLRYLTRRSYIGHMRASHDIVSKDGYTCDDCGQFFTQKRPFSVHIYNHRVIKAEKYKCEHCGKTFTSAALLTRHIRVHTGEKPYECKKCGKRFNHESIFQVHKRTHIGEKAHVCQECGKRFIIATELRYHMAEHYPNDPQYRAQGTKKRACYNKPDNDNSPGIIPTISSKGKTIRNLYAKARACEFENCSYATTSTASWHYHRSTHVRKFQCDICARRFPTNQMLAIHVERTHEGKVAEKTLSCQYCDKKFSSNQKLQCHVDIHENVRRHKCSYCDKAFVQITNLKAHERIHTGEKPYVCRACPAAFITSSGRRKHEKTHPELDKQQPQSLDTKVECGEVELEIDNGGE